MAEKQRSTRSPQSSGITRREFLASAAAAGLLAGLPPGLTAWAADRETARRRRRPIERRTLFFNFAHEADAATARYFLVAGGRRYRLRRLKKNDPVLQRVRRTNTFLQGVPDSALTHVVQNAALPADAVQLVYVAKNPDVVTGTWSMSSMVLIIPSSAIASAYERVRERVPDGPLPLSAKRKLYGHRPAKSLQDLLDEQAVQDVTSHAATLIGMHPEVLSAEPNSAAYIQNNLIATNGATIMLGIQIQALGDAQPQQTPGQPNSTGWATLRPFPDAQGQPLKNTMGHNKGLIQYDPEWHPTVQAQAGAGIGSVVQSVKADPTLGADVTGALAGGTPPPAGTIWFRRDGLTHIDQSLPAVPRAATSLNYTLTPNTPQDGYNCTATLTSNADGTPHVTLNFENTFLRWLGLSIEFLDANGNAVKAPNFLYPFDNTFAFIGPLTPEFTVLGIPVQSSTNTVAFDFPISVASSAKILASGLGSGPHTFPATEPFGIIMTTLFNLAAPTIFIAAGAAQNLDVFQKLAIRIIATGLTEILAFIADINSNGGTGFQNLLNIFVRALSGIGIQIILKIASAVAGIVAASEAEDSVPVAGQIIQAIGAAGASLELTETSIQVANSPWTYEYDLVLTHNVSVTIKPDPNDDTTPKAANQYTVTALFDNGGTPHVQTIALPQPQSEVTVTFTDVPLGGNINISAGFYQVPTDPTQDQVVLGKTTTGLVANTQDVLDPINIAEFKFPLGPNTIYTHKQKTTLDANGNHLWTATATGPTTKDSDITCGGAGTLCEFRSITVRQGTSQAPGYVGYAWQGYSTGVNDCSSSGGQGQLDQLANLNTADNPQKGYATAPCGFPTGVKLGYNLLTHSGANFYLDTTIDLSSGKSVNLIRQVRLDPTPEFANPQNEQAWGKLNLDSTSLLLHPTGRLVSINNANHKLETLKIPTAPMSDDDAAVQLLAQVHAGQGSRPGLIDAPVAAAISPQGVILVLEQSNNRIQAFDTGANPVQFFTKQQSPYFLNLDATESGDTVYLDLAVEFTGYLYVLSYNQSTNLYRLDIYHPGQSDTMPLSTTLNVNAAKLTVDFWRNVYTLNYELLRLPDGTVPAITEPSVSLWVPSTP